MVLALVALAPARAAIVPSLVAGNPISIGPAGAGQLQYNYTVQVAADQIMATGNFLTLFDLVGYVTSSAVITSGDSANYVIKELPLGDYPPGPPAIVPIETALPNITITRTAASALPGGGTFSFSLIATGLPALRVYAAQGTLVAGGADQTVPSANGGQVNGPGRAAVPEPSVTVMLGVAGLVVGCRALRRKRAAV